MWQHADSKYKIYFKFDWFLDFNVRVKKRPEKVSDAHHKLQRLWFRNVTLTLEMEQRFLGSSQQPADHCRLQQTHSLVFSALQSRQQTLLVFSVLCCPGNKHTLFSIFCSSPSWQQTHALVFSALCCPGNRLVFSALCCPGNKYTLCSIFCSLLSWQQTHTL